MLATVGFVYQASNSFGGPMPAASRYPGAHPQRRFVAPFPADRFVRAVLLAGRFAPALAFGLGAGLAGGAGSRIMVR